MENEGIKIVLTEILEDQKQQTLVNAEMISILKTIAENTVQIKQQKRSVDFIIKYKYHGKPVIIIACFFSLLSVLLTSLYFSKSKEANSYKINDLKYQYIKFQAGKSLQKLLLFTDSLYAASPDSLKRSERH